METLPQLTLDWLASRGITDQEIKQYKITAKGGAIAIPITDNNGRTLFYKYRRSPHLSTGPKYWYDQSGTVALFNLQALTAPIVYIAEGEFDAMVLTSYGYPACSSTGGAGSFPSEYIDQLKAKNVYIVFDQDEAGRKAAVKLASKIGARVVAWPRQVPEHGDVTDWFYTLGRSAADFDNVLANRSCTIKDLDQFPTIDDLLQLERSYKNEMNSTQLSDSLRWIYELAIHLIEEKKQELAPPPKRSVTHDTLDKDAAKLVPIQNFYSGKLRRLGNKFTGVCPFHNERTASFFIYPNNTYHCFGCQADGDVIAFVQQTQNLSFIDAVKFLLGQQ